MTDDLSRPVSLAPVSLAKIGSSGLAILVRATPDECAAIAARMDIPAVRSLECSFTLTRDDDGVSIHADGRLRAAVTRVCVVSAEEFDTLVEEEFAVCFVPSGQEQDDPDPDLPDEIPYTGDTIDLGEAAVEQLGLALDPYPRVEGAALPDYEADADDSPFSILARKARPEETNH